MADPVKPVHQAAEEYTSARISLASTGCSISTGPLLEFALAQAQARDAVHSGLAVPSLLAGLRARGLAAVAVRSAAGSRTEYLRRPDLGRTLAPASANLLRGDAEADRPEARDGNTDLLALVLGDGLSALATERHGIPLLDALIPLLESGEPGCAWRLTPIVIAEQARVALADEIGHALHAAATVILLGERPGLSSPDSLGAYITWAPRPGRSDAERNCISNIRPALAGQSPAQAGLSYAAAAERIAQTLREARRLGLTGVGLPRGDGGETPRLRAASIL